jgi:gamma-glutamylaminecyclotransferase
MTATTRLFVYGTLMRGEFHHGTLADAAFEREATTVPSFQLHLVDYYPALLLAGPLAVRGEVYTVPAATLTRLDVLEDVPDLYVRCAIILADGSSAQAYVLRPERLPAGSPLIASGDFRTIERVARRPPGA